MSPTTRDVRIRGLQFTPGDVHVRVGDTVIWSNEDIVTHTATFDDKEGGDEIPAGGTLRFVVPPGDTLAYWCRFHPSMRGRLIIDGGD